MRRRGGRSLAEAGARVILNGRTPDTLAGAVDELRHAGLDAGSCLLDVTRTERIGDTLAALPPIDILVNNAGRRDRRGVQDLSPEALESMLRDHVVASYGLGRAVARSLLERAQPGRIVNISSVVGRLGRRGDVAYATAKAAIDGMTRALAADLGPYRITVNAIAPGTFATETNAHLVSDPTWRQWLQTRTALGRWGVPREIVGAAVFLASDEAAFVTGQTLVVDGGMTTTF